MWHDLNLGSSNYGSCLGIYNSVENIKDPYGHLFLCWWIIFQGNYLKPTRSRNTSHKKFQILRTSILFPPDEIYDTYLEIDDDLQLNVNIYFALLTKAHILDLSLWHSCWIVPISFTCLFSPKYNPAERICIVMCANILIPYSGSAQEVGLVKYYLKWPLY